MRKNRSPVEKVVPIFDPKNLPQGWEMFTIGDVCNKVNKVNPKDDPGSEFDYIDISGIDNKHFRIAVTKRYTGHTAPSRARQLVHSGDIIISTVRTYLKNFARVTPELDGQIASTGFCVLRAATPEIRKYLFFYVQFDPFLNELAKFQRGTSYPAVRDGDVFAQYIPIPPSGQVERIVAEIEKQFSRLDEAVANLKRVKANLKRYKAAVLKAAVEGKLTEEWRKQHPDVEPADKLLERILEERLANWQGRGKYKEPVAPDTSGLPELPEGWVWASAQQLGGHIVDGTHHTPTYVDNGVDFISAKDIDGWKIDFSRCRKIPQEEHSELIKRCHPRLGHVLVTKSGTIGRVAVVKTERQFSLFESVAVIPLIRPVLPEYVGYAVFSAIQGEFGRKWQKGVAVRHLHLEDLRRLPIPLPPLAEQEKCVEEFECLNTVAENIEATIEAELVRADRLRQSILKQAFSGQLVPQDPNDEPARVLLERIGANADGVGATRRVARKRSTESGRGTAAKRRNRLNSQEEIHELPQ